MVEYSSVSQLQLMIRHHVQICKDKDEAEIWFVALNALLSRGNGQVLRRRGSSDSLSSSGSSNLPKGHSQSFISTSSSDIVYEVSSISFWLFWNTLVHIILQHKVFFYMLIAGSGEHTSTSRIFCESPSEKTGKSIIRIIVI